MKITGLELFPVTVPWKRALKMGAARAVTSASSVVIRIHADDGTVGIAETGVMSTSYLGETQDSISSMVSDFIAPNVLLGRDPRDIEAIMADVEKLVVHNAQAKFLVDVALHDLKARVYGMPLYQLLGGRSVDRLPLGWVLSSLSPAEVVEEAQRYVAEGFKLVKYKTGASVDVDIEVIASLRETLGDGISIIVDTNTRWNLREALYAIPRLEEYNLTAIEQPLPEGDLAGLARLRQMSATPIWADESVRTPADLLRAIDAGAMDGLQIKLAKVGGFVKAKEWIDIAKAAGLQVCAGSMAGSGLEANAYGHFLIANEWTARSVAHENIGPIFVHDATRISSQDNLDDLATVMPDFADGTMAPAEGPGLGCELNEGFVQRNLTAGKTPRTIGSVSTAPILVAK